MRKITLVVVVALTAIPLWAGVVSATSDISSPVTMTFIDKTVQSTNVDQGPHGFSAGDAFIFHDVLMQKGNRAGALDGECTFTRVLGHNSAFAFCTGGLRIKGGQVEFTVNAPFTNGRQTFNIGVTGGTGNYRNVRGQAVLEELGGNYARLTLELLP